MLAVARDLVMKFVSVEAALKPIQRLLADRPTPARMSAEIHGKHGGKPA